MASPAGVISICNRALQLLGQKRIADLSDNSASARACSSCYDVLRKAELRKHPWKFAIQRAELAADAVEPEWGKANGFQLPSDFIKLVNDYPETNTLDRDYEIEGRAIYSNNTSPLQIRYVADIEDPNLMDPLFHEVLSAAMAVGMAEELTQSNVKKQMVWNDYRNAINEAKKANAWDSIARQSPFDPWITCRA